MLYSRTAVPSLCVHSTSTLPSLGLTASVTFEGILTPLPPSTTEGVVQAFGEENPQTDTYTCAPCDQPIAASSSASCAIVTPLIPPVMLVLSACGVLQLPLLTVY